MKGGEIVNVGSIQALLGSVQQQGSQVGNTASDGFGLVFNSLLASSPAVVAPVSETAPENTLQETIAALLNATSVEEIVAILSGNEEEGKEVVEKIMGENNFLDVDKQENKMTESFKQLGLEHITGLLNMDAEQLLDKVIPLLEKAGLNESELESVKYLNDFWSVLNLIDKVAPKFFTEMTDALEGKGAISKEQAIELLAVLKSVTIAAPKTDLLTKQEQQVFSLQGFLSVMSEKLGTESNANQNRNVMVQLMEANSFARVIPQAPTPQSGQQEETLKDQPKEAIVQSLTNTVTAPRSEVSLTELESKNNARNEALMREMQNIFKRSNFGQTGGTNRLMIRLYPEHLGQVRIELLQVNGVMTARILASSALGKEMLDSQLHQLRSAFVQQNLQVDRIDISQTLQDTTRNERDQAFNQHFRREQEESTEQNDHNDEEEMTFQEYMIELEA